jgi:formate hydrogenlyase subunit 3/multisubunit Na+/H+ antiporter MnhD subunit
MASLADVDTDLLEAHLTPARVRVFQLIHVALVGGIMVFLVMLLFFFGVGSDADRSETSPAAMDALSLAVAVLTGICLVVGETIYLTYFSSKRLARYGTEPMRERGRMIDDPAEKCLRIVQQATTMRATIFNIPGFFGIVVCLVGMMQGVIFVHAKYLVDALPALVQLGFLGGTFPTRDKILRLVRKRILSSR